MELEDLKGKHILQGIEVGSRKFVNEWDFGEVYSFIKFKLDGIVYMAIEDPSDGYRSYMKDLMVVDEECTIKLPDIDVCCHMRGQGKYNQNDVLEFTDLGNGETILAIGTENTDDYYPYCVMEYYPNNMSCNEGKG